MEGSKARRVCAAVSAFVAMWAVAGCGADRAAPGLQALTESRLDAHLGFLSADLLLGRAPGSPGSRLAAAYIAGQFALANLAPGVAGESFLQQVAFTARRGEPRLSFRAPGGATLRPQLGREFVAWSEDTVGSVRVDAELVFVGYGIFAPDEGWDDFKGVDVRGKALLILADDPGPFLDGRFGGDRATIYGLESTKLLEARRRGATGAILVHQPDSGPGWEWISSIRGSEQLKLSERRSLPGLAMASWITSEVAEQVAAMARLDFSVLLETARSGDLAPMELGVAVSATIDQSFRSFTGANVVGFQAGSDRELAREAVLYTANYDHLGIGKPQDGDSIYNGAVDNASGVAALLALAEAYSRLDRPTRRSIVFLATTGKEGGLLGSSHYLAHPTVPLNQTVAVINLESLNVWGPTEDVSFVGAELSGLTEAAGRAARGEDLSLSSEWAPEIGVMLRSDQYSFLRAGLPAVTVGTGQDFIARLPSWGHRELSAYLAERHHTPKDEYRSDLDLRGAVQQTRVAFRLGLGLAMARERPHLDSSAARLRGLTGGPSSAN